MTVPSRSVTRSARSDVLSLSGLGTFEGNCPRGARSWTLRFVVDPDATETVSYRVGTKAAERSTSIQATRSPSTSSPTRQQLVSRHSFRPSPQGRGLTTAMRVPTTAPLQVIVYQATEPRTLRADVHLALSTTGGESGQCVLVGSSVNAYTYPN